MIILKRIVLLIASIVFLASQDDKIENFHFQFEMDSLELHVGEAKEITIKLLNENGDLAQNPFYVFGQRKSLSVSPRISDSTGVATVTVNAYKPGRLELSVQTITVKRDDRIRDQLVVNVPYPPIDHLVFNQTPGKLYTETSTSFSVEVVDEAGLTRDDVDVELASSNTAVADFDIFGNLETKRTGRVTVSATAEGVTEQFKVRVLKNPVRSVTVSAEKDEIRTGDVLHFDAQALNRSGRSVEDAPVSYTYSGEADYGEFGLPAAGLVTEDGRFVAETAGIYTVTAFSGGYSDQKTVRVVPRDVKQNVKLVGHGLISDVFTGDLWVWAGVGKHEGKDFAATGTVFGNGEAYFWDVTNPDSMLIIDTVTVDARNVNDVKISEDGRVGVISREGASNRKNGFVILDVSDPYNVEILSTFNDDMTGGVHNTFIYENHVYAVNNGRKYDIINIEDPKNPFRVGIFELDTPGHSIHDVWVENGIAYSSNWHDGVVAVDVGGLKFSEKNRSDVQYNPLLMKAGQGSPSDPVKLAEMKDSKGRNHSAFPFLSQSTGNFYIISGDEWFPFGMNNLYQSKPSSPRGGFHFMNFNDPDNPREEATYMAPEVGSHNQWVYNDILLAAFYQGGVRILDISGELLGDLYKQGREIGFFKSSHKEGKIPNAPMVWGAQPYKDYIFFSDMNSGLYCIQLEDNDKKGPSTP
jgi:hypothetical protein